MLAACKENWVAGSQPPRQAVPSVARIIGVTQVQIDTMRDNERRRNEQEQKDKRKVTTRSAYDREIGQAAALHNIDPLFLHAIVETESGYRPRAVSRAGALGLMQIMPDTGRELGVDRVALFDPSRNIEAGARHLKSLQSRYGANLELILGAYNAGAGAVARYGNRVPPYAETQGYVARVMQRYRRLLGHDGAAL